LEEVLHGCACVKWEVSLLFWVALAARGLGHAILLVRPTPVLLLNVQAHYATTSWVMGMVVLKVFAKCHWWCGCKHSQI